MGDGLDFTAVYNLYYERIYRVSYSIVRDQHHAEDIVQETFIKALNKAETLEDMEKVGAWLTVIASRTAIDFIRKEKRCNSCPIELDRLDCLGKPSNQNVETEVEAGLMKEHLIEVMQGLTSEYKDLLVLKLEQGLKEREIAAVLNMNASTVKTRIHRARRKLKMLVERERIA